MITLQQIQDFFRETRSIREMGRSSWDIDGECLWSYFFVDHDVNKLLPVAEHMEALGYDVAGILEPGADDEDPVYFLRVDRIEHHSPESLHNRNGELYLVAERFGIESYDGMDVGTVDET